MKMKNKISALLLVSLSAIALTACAGNAPAAGTAASQEAGQGTRETGAVKETAAAETTAAANTAPAETGAAAETAAAEKAPADASASDADPGAEAAEATVSDAEPGAGNAAAAPEALVRVFSEHDTYTDDITEFNGKVDRWGSYPSDEDERACYEAMNVNFKDALFLEFIDLVEKGESGRLYWYHELSPEMIVELYRKEAVDTAILKDYTLACLFDADGIEDEAFEKLLESDKKLKKRIEREKEKEANDFNGGFFGVGKAAPAPMTGLMYTEAAADTAAFETYYVPTEAEEPMGSEPFDTSEFNVIHENAFKSVAASPLSTFSIDVDTAGYTQVKYDVLEGSPIDRDEVKIEELINYFNFDYSAADKAGEPFTVSTEYTDCPWNKEHDLLRIGIRADEASEDLNTNFVLVADVSGSMMRITKLPLALSAYADMVEGFGENDKISLMYYADGTGVVLDGESCGEKDKVYRALAQTFLAAGGGTNGAVGLDTAYEMAKKSFIEGGVNRVILATDGDFNIGRTSSGALKALVEEGRKTGVYLTILGYGSENLKDNKMETMAENGNGNYYYIGDNADARKALVTESASTLIPMADDVKIQVEFNPDVVGEYRLIGYESRILNAEDFENDKVDAGEVGAGKTVTALYELVPAGAGSETSVPELKYQKPAAGTGSSDVCTVAIRYKDVNSAVEGSESMLVEYPVSSEDFTEVPSAETALAISLAEFGMVLRDSEFKGTSTLSTAEAIADAVFEVTGDPQTGDYAELIRTLKEQSK